MNAIDNHANLQETHPNVHILCGENISRIYVSPEGKTSVNTNQKALGVGNDFTLLAHLINFNNYVRFSNAKVIFMQISSH